MIESIFESLRAFIVMVFRHEIGTTGFYISVGGTCVGIIVVARLFAGLFGSKKGVFIAFWAACLPVLLASIGYVAVELYALPEIKAEWAEAYLPWSVFGVVLLLTGCLLSSKLWDIGGGSAVVVLVLAGLAGVAAQYTAELVVSVIDTGSSQVEKRHDRLNFELE